MAKRLWELFYTFAKVGVMTFGGGYAMLPILQREVVENKGWATEEELADWFAIGQCTPGIIAVNTATFIGQKHRGWLGGIVATLGVVFPSLVIISILAGLITNFSHLAWVQNAFAGIQVCVCVLIFNAVLKSTGLIDQNINWLGDERYALACIILILLTTSVGQPIVLYVSALGNVDASLVEAANVDGATSLQAFWKIKWPQIMPTTLYIVVITTINSFQCFALIQLLTSGGPNHSTDTIMYYIYYSAFKLYRYGYGDAMGVVLAIMIAILSAIQFKFGNSND